LNIKSRVIDLLQLQFSWLTDDEYSVGVSNRVRSQGECFSDLAISLNDLAVFSEVLAKEFELDEIPFADVCKWHTIQDMVWYVRNRKKPFISGFEVEA